MSDGDRDPNALAPGNGRLALWVVLAGIALFVVLLILPAPAGMSKAAWRVAAVGLLMAFWWVTEVLPVAATALLPLVLFPLLGVAGLRATAAPYADPVIFLFLGGLMLGLALQRWGLHLRIALRIIAWIGLRPANLVLGFMVATAFISMWVSNTATAAMMMPVGVSLVVLLVGSPAALVSAPREKADFARALLIGIAYGATIGGVATLIGTPPNALFVGFMRRIDGVEIGFAQWMMLGVPVAVVFLLGTWLLLTRVIFHVPAAETPAMRERIGAALGSLPPMSRPEKRVGLVFLAAAVAWMLRPELARVIPGLDDAVIAVAAAFALFIIPSGRDGFLMDWASAARLPWDVLLLFGGGLSLAAAITSSGLSTWIGNALSELGVLPLVVLIGALVLVTTVLSELVSNTATAAALLPVVASIGGALGLDPVALTVPVVLAASCAFMLPVATPPNALAFGSGCFTVAQMARAGFLVDLLGTALVLGASYSIVWMVF